MSTLTAKKLSDALDKAKNVGFVEETFTVENCEVTLRNLRPDEYVASMEACEGLEDVAYLHAYQKEHLSRSIVVLNGVDLREVKHVEVEEPDPKKSGEMRTVKVELHTFLLTNVVNTWGKEAIFTTYRKFSEVLEAAERKANEGVKFIMPEETEEEKYRRLLLEAKEVEGELPNALVETILGEHGWMQKSTAEEAKAAMERADQLAREEAKKAEEGSPEPSAQEAPKVVERPQESTAEPAPTPQAAPEPETPARPPAKVPVDPHATLQKVIETRRKAPVQSAQEEKSEDEKSSRAAQIAALEAEAGIGVEVPEGAEIPVLQPEDAPEVAELKKQEPVDPKKAARILDQPPVSGINPRFKPPTRV